MVFRAMQYKKSSVADYFFVLGLFRPEDEGQC